MGRNESSPSLDVEIDLGAEVSVTVGGTTLDALVNEDEGGGAGAGRGDKRGKEKKNSAPAVIGAAIFLFAATGVVLEKHRREIAAGAEHEHVEHVDLWGSSFPDVPDDGVVMSGNLGHAGHQAGGMDHLIGNRQEIAALLEGIDPDDLLRSIGPDPPRTRGVTVAGDRVRYDDGVERSFDLRMTLGGEPIAIPDGVTPDDAFIARVAASLGPSHDQRTRDADLCFIGQAPCVIGEVDRTEEAPPVDDPALPFFLDMDNRDEFPRDVLVGIRDGARAALARPLLYTNSLPGEGWPDDMEDDVLSVGGDDGF